MLDTSAHLCVCQTIGRRERHGEGEEAGQRSPADTGAGLTL